MQRNNNNYTKIFSLHEVYKAENVKKMAPGNRIRNSSDTLLTLATAIELASPLVGTF